MLEECLEPLIWYFPRVEKLSFYTVAFGMAMAVGFAECPNLERVIGRTKLRLIERAMLGMDGRCGGWDGV